MSVSDSTYGAAFGDGASVLERVLLAIINAHTTDATEGRQAERLQAAMGALIGAPNGHNIERALLFMGRHRQRDICDVEMHALRSYAGAPKCATRTVPELATLAAREVMGCTAAVEVQATARVLCEIFRKRGNAYGLAPDNVQEALEAEAVQRFCDELAEWDVPTRL
jgi:hypothetical protein